MAIRSCEFASRGKLGCERKVREEEPRCVTEVSADPCYVMSVSRYAVPAPLVTCRCGMADSRAYCQVKVHGSMVFLLVLPTKIRNCTNCWDRQAVRASRLQNSGGFKRHESGTWYNCRLLRGRLDANQAGPGASNQAGGVWPSIAANRVEKRTRE